MTNVVEVETVNTEATVTVMTEIGTEVEGTGRGEVGATTDVVTVTSTVEVEETAMMEDILLDMTAIDAVTTEAHAMMSMLYLVQAEEPLVRTRHHVVAIDVDEEKAEMEWEPQREGPQLLKVLYLFLSGSARLQAGTSMHLVTSSILLSRPNKLVRLFLFFPVLSLTDVSKASLTFLGLIVHRYLPSSVLQVYLPPCLFRLLVWG
jgi:hypothetical protein